MHILIVLVDFSKKACQGLQTAMLGFEVGMDGLDSVFIINILNP
jgi:hypothetical protein